jgi:hypothetical protein
MVLSLLPRPVIQAEHAPGLTGVPAGRGPLVGANRLTLVVR